MNIVQVDCLVGSVTKASPAGGRRKSPPFRLLLEQAASAEPAPHLRFCLSCHELKPWSAFYPSEVSKTWQTDDDRSCGICKDCRAERVRRWLRTPKGRACAAASWARHKARKLAGSTPEGQQAVTAFYVWARSVRQVRCYLCGRWTPRAQRQVDHVMPLSKGGKHEAENLTVLCARCNLSKSAKLPRQVGLLF